MGVVLAHDLPRLAFFIEIHQELLGGIPQLAIGIIVGAVRVAGMIVPRSGPFRIEVPGEYSVVAANGSFRGKLDGTLYSAPRFLGAGLHTLAADSPEHPSAVIWSRAAAYGLTPFVRMRAARDRG